MNGRSAALCGLTSTSTPNTGGFETDWPVCDVDVTPRTWNQPASIIGLPTTSSGALFVFLRNSVLNVPEMLRRRVRVQHWNEYCAEYVSSLSFQIRNAVFVVVPGATSGCNRIRSLAYVARASGSVP